MKSLQILTVCFLGLILYGCGPSSARQNDAWHAAQQFVLERNGFRPDIKLPIETDPGVKIETLTADRFHISAWAESKNGYEVLVRQDWTCIAQYDGDGKWSIHDYEVSMPQEGTYLPSTVTLKPSKDSTVPAFVDFDDYLDYDSWLAHPEYSKIDFAGLQSRGKLVYLEPQSKAKPLKRIMMSTWQVEVLEGPQKGMHFWLSNNNVEILTQPAKR